MRDFRDAKAMAQTLRTSLTAKAVSISHSESLELVSKMFGIADWNTLSAQIQAGREATPAANAERTASYPAIPIRDFVPFPSAMVPLFVGRAKTIGALDQAFQRQREVVLAVQKDSGVDEPGHDDVYDIAVLAGVVDLIRLGDGTIKVIVQAYRRVRIRRLFGEAGAHLAEVDDLIEGPIPDAPDLVQAAVEQFRIYAGVHGIETGHFWPLLATLRDPGRIADIIGSHVKLSISEKHALLATLDPVARLEKVQALMAADPSKTAA
jgi:ATP-dependent Lon protease